MPAQALRPRLPTAAIRVPGRLKSCGICDDQRSTGTGILPSTSVSFPIIISTNWSTIINIHHLGLMQRPINDSGNSGLRSTQPRRQLINRKKLLLLYKQSLWNFRATALCKERYMQSRQTVPNESQVNTTGCGMDYSDPRESPVDCCQEHSSERQIYKRWRIYCLT